MTRENGITVLKSVTFVPLTKHYDVQTDVAKRKQLRAWVRALRSGKYAQGLSFLYHEDDDGSKGYCCLGVYCQVVDKIAPEALEDVYYPRDIRGTSIEGVLPDEIQIILANLNDGTGKVRGSKSFSYIADVIEAVYLAPLPRKKKVAA